MRFIEGAARQGSRLMMSYRDKAFPTTAELKEQFASHYVDVGFRRRAVEYGIARYAPEGPGHNAQEYLLIGTKPKALKTAAAKEAERGCHTSITGEIRSGGLESSGEELLADDKRFSFILVHAGANRNGDFFTVEELRAHYRTAVGTKVDL